MESFNQLGSDLVHSVSFAEFDIDVGNCLKESYPPFALEEYDKEYLGNLCLPDGAHLTQDDRIFLALPLKNPRCKYEVKVPEEAEEKGSGVGSKTSGVQDSALKKEGGGEASDASDEKSATDEKAQAAQKAAERAQVMKDRRKSGARRSAPKRKSMKLARPMSMGFTGARLSMQITSTTQAGVVKGGARRGNFLGGQRRSTQLVTRQEVASGGAAETPEVTATHSAVKAPKEAAGTGATGKEALKGCVLYGVASFANVPAPVRRGAIQRSLLVLMWQPLYTAFIPLLQHTLLQMIPENKLGKSDSQVLREVYETLSAFTAAYVAPSPLTMFDHTAHIDLDLGGFVKCQGASLLQLLQRFQSDVMVFWHAMMAGKRIIFCGHPAGDVGMCCISAQLLSAPLSLYEDCITPYAGLPHLDVFLRSKYIAGTTNSLFESKKEWFDVLGNVTTGEVVSQLGVKIPSHDRVFIKSLLAGVASGEVGEAQARQRFTTHTLRHLCGVMERGECAGKEGGADSGALEATPEYKEFVDHLRNKKLADRFLRSPDVDLDGRQVLCEMVAIATAPPLMLPESWPDAEIDAHRFNKKRDPIACILRMDRDRFRVLNRKGELRSSHPYAKVSVMERSAEDGGSADQFVLMIEGVRVTFSSHRMGRVCDELEARGRYVRGIIASARKTGVAEERDKFGQTRLHRACRANDVAQVKRLLQEKLDVNAVDAGGMTPLLVACQSDALDVIDVLVDRPDIEINIPDKTHTTVFHELVTRWPSPATPAQEERLIGIMTTLKKRGGHVRLHGRSGETPLHQAVILQNYTAMEWLVKNGANLNAASDFGETPLHYAIRARNKRAIQFLLDHGADKHAANKDGTTALGAAKETEFFAILCGLPEGEIGATGSADTDEYGQSPLHIASQQGRMDKVFQLISSGSSVNVVDRNGWTPLHNAASQGHLDVFQLLLRAPNVDVNAKTKDMTSVMHYLVRQRQVSDVDMIRALDGMLRNNVDIDVRDKCGETPLHQAIFRGGTRSVAWLLKNGADINAVANSYTPLHMAVQRGDPAVVSLLMDFDADMTVGSKDGTPKEMAQKYCPPLVALFEHLESGRGGMAPSELVEVEEELGEQLRQDDSPSETPKKKAMASFFSALKAGATTPLGHHSRDHPDIRRFAALEEAQAEFWQRRFTSHVGGVTAIVDGVGNVSFELSEDAMKGGAGELAASLATATTAALKERKGEQAAMREAALEGCLTDDMEALVHLMNN